MIKLLFVCTGNICRSPTADGVMRVLAQRAGLGDVITVDSAGTTGYHAGEAPDPRTAAVALARGYDLSSLRARRVTAADFDDFTMVLAMDRGHQRELSRLCPPGRQERLSLFLSFAPQFGTLDVPDPYYGGARGFDLVLDMIEAGCQGLLEHVRAGISGRSSA